MDLIIPLEALRERFDRVEHDLALPQASANPPQILQLSREHARLVPIMGKAQRYRNCLRERKDLYNLTQSTDADLQKLAAEDLPRLDSEIASLEQELQLAILPKDPNEDRNIILEIRAGAGGDEAGLFAADLLRMYTRYAEMHGWTVDPIDSSVSERGGIKEVVIQIS